jgi:hypothetical protein
MKKQWWKYLLVIMAVGLAFRVVGLGNLSFTADEFLDVNSSAGYAKTGVWQAWNFNLERPDTGNINVARDQRASVYKWQVAETMKVFGVSETSARAVSVAWGLVTILLLYFATLYFTGKREIALLAAFLCAVSISSLEIDRRVRMYAMFVPVFLALWWMTYRVIDEAYTGKQKFLKLIWDRFGFNFVYFLPAAVLGVLSLWLHLLAVNIVAIALVYALLRWVKTHRSAPHHFNKYAFIWAKVVVIIVLVRLLLPSAYGLIVASLNFPDNHYSYLNIVFDDYSQPIPALLLMLLGGWWLVTKRSLGTKGLWVASSFPTLLFLAIFVWKRNVGAQYIAFAQPLKMILVAAGMYAVILFLKKRVTGITARQLGFAVVLLLVLVPNFAYFFQENNLYHQTSKGDQPNYARVFAFMIKNRQPDDALITRSFRNYYWRTQHIITEDFGGELVKMGQAEKLTLAKLQGIIAAHPQGWVILSENDYDYVSHDAEQYISQNMTKRNDIDVRGPISVFHWGS